MYSLFSNMTLTLCILSFRLLRCQFSLHSLLKIPLLMMDNQVRKEILLAQRKKVHMQTFPVSSITSSTHNFVLVKEIKERYMVNPSIVYNSIIRISVIWTAPYCLLFLFCYSLMNRPIFWKIINHSWHILLHWLIPLNIFFPVVLPF